MRLRIAAAGLLFGLIGLITLPFLAIGTVASPAPAANAPAQPHTARCTDATPSTPHFYFFDKEKESSGAFGPSADKDNDTAVKQELVRRLCGDKRTGQDLVLIDVLDRLHATTPGIRPFNSDRGSVPDIANSLVREDIDWGRSKVITTTAPDGALTLFMRQTTNSEPSLMMTGAKLPRVLVTPLSQAHRHSRFLMLYFHGSNTPVLLRLPCGFQPVFTDAHRAAMVTH